VPPQAPAPPQKGSKTGCIIGVIVGIIILILAVFLFWRFVWPLITSSTNTIPETNNTSTTKATIGAGKMDQQLIGTWVSACLIPDENSPWAEKHQFVISADGTAVHTRWSNDTQAKDCASPTMTLTNNYKITIPASGQINLYDSEKQGTAYDIYQISGTTLLFGHGFRGDKAAYPAHQGSSEADRIESLNQFIIYSKK